MREETHTEEIICPTCNAICDGTVDETMPFWTYFCQCKCGEMITESDWQLSPRGQLDREKAIAIEQAFIKARRCR